MIGHISLFGPSTRKRRDRHRPYRTEKCGCEPDCARHLRHEFLPCRPGACGSVAHPSARHAVSPYRTASRPARCAGRRSVSTITLAWPTGMCRCCTSATASVVTCSGSNTIRPIANSRRPRSANSASMPCRIGKASSAGRKPTRWWRSMPSRFCSTRPNSAWDARSTSPTARQTAVDLRRAALKAKYLDGLTQTDVSKIDPGRPVHD